MRKIIRILLLAAIFLTTSVTVQAESPYTTWALGPGGNFFMTQDAYSPLAEVELDISSAEDIFITPEYARQWVDEYRSRGYDAKIIQKENSRFSLVSAESHESVRRAIARVNQFQDTVEMDSWIYTRR